VDAEEQAMHEEQMAELDRDIKARRARIFGTEEDGGDDEGEPNRPKKKRSPK
jgi:hypothetical protein